MGTGSSVAAASAQEQAALFIGGSLAAVQSWCRGAATRTREVVEFARASVESQSGPAAVIAAAVAVGIFGLAAARSRLRLAGLLNGDSELIALQQKLAVAEAQADEHAAASNAAMDLALRGAAEAKDWKARAEAAEARVLAAERRSGFSPARVSSRSKPPPASPPGTRTLPPPDSPSAIGPKTKSPLRAFLPTSSPSPSFEAKLSPPSGGAGTSFIKQVAEGSLTRSSSFARRAKMRALAAQRAHAARIAGSSPVAKSSTDVER